RYKQDALPRLMMAFDEDPVHRLGILDTVGRYYGEAGRAWLANIAASAVEPAVRAKAEDRLSASFDDGHS
ncbi:MAG TPA: hypothetical protein VHZ74_26480, partial [Bryobacteraceae bacterium]|nr:hypothetical protein [Bryobacteraceae bacterium]